MKFRFEDTLDVNADEAMRLYADPATLETLLPHMPSMDQVEVLETVPGGNVMRRRVRYRPHPFIKKVGPKDVDPRWMEWVEESEFDFRARTVRFRNVPTHRKVASLMQNAGTIEFVPSGTSCKRVMSGELHVRVPLLGRVAEHVIHTHAASLLREEVTAFKRYLATR